MMAQLPDTVVKPAPRSRTGKARRSGRRTRTLAKFLTSHHSRIARRRRSLSNIAVCFTDQAFILPMQCEEAQLRLDELRREARQTRAFLEELDPETTKRLTPYGCIAKLGSLDFWLSQAILGIAMFGPICQSICYDRIELHLYIRSLFPRIAATYEDVLSQLAVLSECQSSQSQRRERQVQG